MANTCETTSRLHKPARQQSKQDKRQKIALREIWTSKTYFSNKEGSLKNRLPLYDFKISATRGIEFKLFIYSCYAWEHLTLDCFEKGAATGRDVGNLVGKTELGAACYRITAADE